MTFGKTRGNERETLLSSPHSRLGSVFPVWLALPGALGNWILKDAFVSLFLRNVLLPVSHLVPLGWVLVFNPSSNPALKCLVSFYTVILLVE